MHRHPAARQYQGNDKVFLAACRLALTDSGMDQKSGYNFATYRQYRKWLQGRGAAHARRIEAKTQVENEAAKSA